MWCMVSFCLIANEESLWHDIMLQKSLRVSVETVVLGPAELFDLHREALTTKGVPRCSFSLTTCGVHGFSFLWDRSFDVRLPCWSSGEDSTLSVQRAWVQSRVRELQCHMSTKKKKFWCILEMTLVLQSEALGLNPSSITYLLVWTNPFNSWNPLVPPFVLWEYLEKICFIKFYEAKLIFKICYVRTESLF